MRYNRKKYCLQLELVNTKHSSFLVWFSHLFHKLIACVCLRLFTHPPHSNYWLFLTVFTPTTSCFLVSASFSQALLAKIKIYFVSDINLMVELPPEPSVIQLWSLSRVFFLNGQRKPRVLEPCPGDPLE